MVFFLDVALFGPHFCCFTFKIFLWAFRCWWKRFENTAMHVQFSSGHSDGSGALCKAIATQKSIFKMFLRFWSAWEVKIDDSASPKRRFHHEVYFPCSLWAFEFYFFLSSPSEFQIVIRFSNGLWKRQTRNGVVSNFDPQSVKFDVLRFVSSFEPLVIWSHGLCDRLAFPFWRFSHWPLWAFWLFGPLGLLGFACLFFFRWVSSSSSFACVSFSSHDEALCKHICFFDLVHLTRWLRSEAGSLRTEIDGRQTNGEERKPKLVGRVLFGRLFEILRLKNRLQFWSISCDPRPFLLVSSLRIYFIVFGPILWPVFLHQDTFTALPFHAVWLAVLNVSSECLFQASSFFWRCNSRFQTQC